MSTYTSGELAKLCNVTVRTVQYYDSRGILTPYDYSEGGRRLFNDDDLQRLQVICFLKELGFSLNNIADVLKEDNADNILKTLLDKQETDIRSEIAEKEQKLKQIQRIKKSLKNEGNINIEKLNDIANLMGSIKYLKQLRMRLLAGGLALALIEYSTLFYGIITGQWIPFAVGMLVTVAGSIPLTMYYFRYVQYVCPECHKKFKPGYWKLFFAPHTPNTRKLICPCCGHKGYAVEVFSEKENSQ